MPGKENDRVDIELIKQRTAQNKGKKLLTDEQVRGKVLPAPIDPNDGWE